MDLEHDRLFHLLRAMAPFADDSLIVGACVIPLYQQHLGEPVRAIRTIDLDVATNLDGDEAAIATFLQRLAELPGYRVEPRGTGYSPATSSSVLVPMDDSLPTIEVLGRRTRDRPNKRGASADRWFGSVQPQLLDGLSILFRAPWRVELDTESIPVPNPLSFVLQKAVIRRSGRGAIAKGSSDVQAVFQVARAFASHRESLAALWESVNGAAARRCRQALDRCQVRLLVEDSAAVVDASSALSLIEPNARPADLCAELRAFLNACGAPLS